MASVCNVDACFSKDERDLHAGCLFYVSKSALASISYLSSENAFYCSMNSLNVASL